MKKLIIYLLLSVLFVIPAYALPGIADQAVELLGGRRIAGGPADEGRHATVFQIGAPLPCLRSRRSRNRHDIGRAPASDPRDQLDQPCLLGCHIGHLPESASVRSPVPSRAPGIFPRQAERGFFFLRPSGLSEAGAGQNGEKPLGLCGPKPVDVPEVPERVVGDTPSRDMISRRWAA